VAPGAGSVFEPPSRVAHKGPVPAVTEGLRHGRAAEQSGYSDCLAAGLIVAPGLGTPCIRSRWGGEVD